MDSLFEELAPKEETVRYAIVAPELSIGYYNDGLTYKVPKSLADVQVGDRVMVPLGRGNKQVAGYILRFTDHANFDPKKIKPISKRDKTAVNLPPDLIELSQWISRYYCCPIGMVLASMLPAAVKRGTGLVKRKLVELNFDPQASKADDLIKELKLPKLQAHTLRTAIELQDKNLLPIDPKELADHAGAKSVASVNQLVDKSLLKHFQKTEVHAVWSEFAIEPPKDLTLNDDQQNAVDTVVNSMADGFKTHLLHGVTGSGKTEVYIRIIERIVELGGTAIVMVPEISLTPQTAGRFIGRFERVAVLHSGLTASQRHEQWSLIRNGWAQVVVGARSVVFAPCRDLGAIIVDEEHDSSYKQDQLPRYHGRDVAIMRAHHLGIPVILGSATPSLESYNNATKRNLYNLISLPKRAGSGTLPKIEIIDMATEQRERYAETKAWTLNLLSRRLEKLLTETLTAGGQAILLLNRRGYANYIACPDSKCGWMMTCHHCDVSLVYHVHKQLPRGGLVRCHQCGFENLMASTCPDCGKRVSAFGLGTQRVEEEINHKIDAARMLRMDSDTMNKARDYEVALERFRKNEVNLLVGTQMIAKGLDFPNVRLVGVVSADTALNLPDFRASERAYQLISQVSGRSGRGDHEGRVVIQTFTPDHSAIQLAAANDYVKFADTELETRERAGLPPVKRMARIVARDHNLEKCQAAIEQLHKAVMEANETLATPLVCQGPMPCSIARISDYHRWEIELIADNSASLQALLGKLMDAKVLKSDTHTAVDVDPISLM